MRSATIAGRLFPPLDRRLWIPPRGASLGLSRAVCAANQAGSFPKAAALLALLAGLRLSVKRVQLITEQVGARMDQTQQQRTNAFLQAGPTPGGAAVPLLVLSADGGRVQTRQADPEQKWKETRVGVVYEAVPRPEQPGLDYQGARPGPRSVLAGLDSWERFGERLSAAADARGYARAREKVFVADAAGSLRALRERCFPDAQFILDWPHAVEHVHACAIARFGAGQAADAWFERQKDRLWHGQLTAFFAALDRAGRQLGAPPRGADENDPRRVLATNRQYFRTNRPGLDYPAFRRRGWPIASGLTEATVKQLGQRVKGSEKHWTIAGAHRTLQVISALIATDGAWERFWKHYPLSWAA
jgi:hypothetical protein